MAFSVIFRIESHCIITPGHSHGHSCYRTIPVRSFTTKLFPWPGFEFTECSSLVTNLLWRGELFDSRSVRRNGHQSRNVGGSMDGLQDNEPLLWSWTPPFRWNKYFDWKSDYYAHVAVCLLLCKGTSINWISMWGWLESNWFKPNTTQFAAEL